jgi:para-nitrobenzyl esterase
MRTGWKVWLLISTVSLAPVHVHGGVQVQTDSGLIEGTSDGPLHIFLGVPFAAPPTGDLRWKPPATLTRWSGVRATTGFGARCLQAPAATLGLVFRDGGGSEDCLTLNVWSPANDAQARLPVMVWIHGGAFNIGASSETRYDGRFLARQGLVVVTLNYRLGVFGFFVLPELVTESPRGAAGNYGLLDQLAALEWVHRNIAAFGGDPANVTLFGESAGSLSVSVLMASPQAKSLFSRAIGQSGSAFYSDALTPEPLAARGQADLQFAAASLRAQTLKELRAVPADPLLEAAMKAKGPGGRPRFLPNVDGYVLSEPVPAIFAAGKQNDVPLLAGWNHDEGSFETLLTPRPLAALGLTMRAQKEFGARAPDFLRLYPATSDAEALRSLADLAGDRFVAWSTWKWLEAQVTTGKQRAYRYRFDLAPPSSLTTPAALGAFHTAEIEYVFGTLGVNPSRSWRPDDRALSGIMQAYWINFARTGDPNGPGLPQWPVYVPANGWPVMALSPQPGAVKDDRRERYLFLNSVWAK